MSVLTDTQASVDSQWRTARMIHAKVGQWGFMSVRHALACLAEQGSIDAKYSPHTNGTVVLYRTLQKEKADAGQG